MFLNYHPKIIEEPHLDGVRHSRTPSKSEPSGIFG